MRAVTATLDPSTVAAGTRASALSLHRLDRTTDGDWDEITVPGHWVLAEERPWGARIHTNVTGRE